MSCLTLFYGLSEDLAMHTLKRHLTWILILSLLIGVAAFVAAQQVIDVNANISFPPPVYLLRGVMPIRGSANLPDMTHYYVEFRALNADGTAQEDTEPWFPAIYGEDPVTDNELGQWDTRLVEDGLYELRLNINLESGSPVFVVVSPLRVENDIPPFLITPTPVLTATSSLPTLLPTPTALAPNPRPTSRPTQTGLENVPRVTALVDANLRAGDSTIYRTVGVLLTGEEAQVLGISTSGSNWYFVQAPNGTEGWIAPSTVTFAGDITTVPYVSPPPTPTFTPIPATATPLANPDMIVNGFRFDPLTPACGQSFSIFMNITNIGTAASTSGGVVTVQDVLVSNNQVIATATGTFNPIAVGSNFVVVVAMFVNAAPNQAHRIIVSIDTSAQIFESNENNNSYTQDYTLAQGSCP
jgi:uncharacterized protein YgiM (DUF1202 family)